MMQKYLLDPVEGHGHGPKLQGKPKSKFGKHFRLVKDGSDW